MRTFWIIVAIVCGVYIFIPEPSDVFPVIGWIDEGIALFILSYALKKLNVHWLDKIIGFFKSKK